MQHELARYPISMSRYTLYYIFFFFCHTNDLYGYVKYPSSWNKIPEDFAWIFHFSTVSIFYKLTRGLISHLMYITDGMFITTN